LIAEEYSNTENNIKTINKNMKEYRDIIFERVKNLDNKQHEIFEKIKEIVEKSSVTQNSRLRQIGEKLLAGNEEELKRAKNAYIKPTDEAIERQRRLMEEKQMNKSGVS